MPFAREAVLAADAFSEAVENQGAALSGAMRLGIIPTIAPYLAPVLLDGLPATLPSLKPELRELVTGDVIDMLTQGQLDAAIVSVDGEQPRTTAIPMFDEPLVLVVPATHPWAEREDVAPNELDGQKLLLLDEGNCLRDQALQLCHRHSERPPAAVATTLATVVRMVAHGVGMTVVPEGALSLMGTESGYAVIRFKEPAPVRRLGLVYRSSSSRTADFAQLAEVITHLAQDAGMPVLPVQS